MIQDWVEKAQAALNSSDQAISELHDRIREREQAVKDAFTKAMEHIGSSVIDLDELDEFILEWEKRPYAIVPRREGEWLLIIPKIFKLAYGWLEKQEGAYNYFVVNRYFDLIQPVPDTIKEELDLSRPFDGIVVDDGLLSIKRPDRDDINDVQKRYARYLTQRPLDDRSIRVKKGQEFNLIAALIRDGILPFVPRPVAREDMIDRHSSMKLRDYQEQDFKTFMKTGAVGIMYPMGMGKTMVALEAMCQIKGPKLVLVPTLTLKEQWLERIKKQTPLVEDEYRIEVYHQRQMAKLSSTQWSLVIYDEMHRIAANSWLQLTTLPTKYRLNLTGTPFREDGRIDIVWALSGLPLGVDWTYFLDKGLIVKPQITVHIVKDMRGKFDYVDGVIDEKKKTIIFSDSLELGEDLAKKHKIPFVHGKTPGNERLDIIRSNERIVVSRVGDLGISIENLQRVIEFDFLFGSRSQELQRLGRLFHSEYKDEHVVLMTITEYVRYKKRLFGIYEKGFEINIERGEGVPVNLSDLAFSSVVMDSSIHDYAPPRKTAKSVTTIGPTRPTLKAEEVSQDTSKFPIIDERRKLNRDLIREILRSPFCVEQKGIPIKVIRAVLDHNHIKYTNYNQVMHLVNSMFAAFEIGGRTTASGRIYFLEQNAQKGGENQ